MDKFRWQIAKEIEELTIDYGMDFEELLDKAVTQFRNVEGKKTDYEKYNRSYSIKSVLF